MTDPARIEAAARAMADVDENEWDELSAAATPISKPKGDA